jgi:hypothetical protein
MDLINEYKAESPLLKSVKKDSKLQKSSLDLPIIEFKVQDTLSSQMLMRRRMLLLKNPYLNIQA